MKYTACIDTEKIECSCLFEFPTFHFSQNEWIDKENEKKTHINDLKYRQSWEKSDFSFFFVHCHSSFRILGG